MRILQNTVAGFAILLGSAASVHADVQIYDPVGAPRGDADLQAATRYCDYYVGVVRSGEATPAAYKQCMLAFGWQYRYTKVHYYTDPDYPGERCHDIVIFGITGESCSNF